MEIHAHTTSERLFSVLVLLLAIVTFSMFLSSVTQAMFQLSSLHRTQQRQDNGLRRFMFERHASAEIFRSVKDYLRTHRSNEHLSELQVEVLQLLPTGLLADLHDDIRAPLLCMHLVFARLRLSSPRAVRSICHAAMHERPAVQGETLFAFGDACGKMLLVMRGAINYEKRSLTGSQSMPFRVQPSRGYIKQRSAKSRSFVDANVPMDGEELSPGDRLSEAALWTRWENRGDAVSRQESLLLSVDAVRLAEIAQEHEIVYVQLIEYACRYVKLLDRTDPSDTMEMPPDEDRCSVMSGESSMNQKSGAAPWTVLSSLRRGSFRSR